LPDWLYALLPFLYLGMGGLVATSLGNLAGIASGLLLMGTGLLVLWWRVTYRIAMRATRKRASTTRATARPHPHLINLVWSTEYESGNGIIDTQHRVLFSQANEIVNAILDGQPKADVELLLDDLVQHVEQHFATEEALIEAAGTPGLAKHREVHRHLLSLCKGMTTRFHRDELSVGELFQFLTINVISEHILYEDLGCFSAATA
jgi:hemerythrin-like metal-binding protein